TGKGPDLTISKITDYDNYLRATYPWSIMVSAQHHTISIVDEIQARTSFRRGGIADMRISEDFVIGPWKEVDNKAWEEPREVLTLQESLEAHYLVTKKQLKQTQHGDS
ncbi:MAG: hypothetical protein AAFQ08_01490, partial [Bacteroidota bacterium]